MPKNNSTNALVENTKVEEDHSDEQVRKKAKVMSSSDLKEYFELEDEHVHVARKRTTVEKEVKKHREQAHELVAHLPVNDLPTVQAYIPSTLAGAIFCGHLVTDLDSIAGAIGAAELYGGIAARASEINPETTFALKHWGIDVPPRIEDLLVEYPKAGVCLVDHQQTSQLNKSIDVSFPSKTDPLPRLIHVI